MSLSYLLVLSVDGLCLILTLLAAKPSDIRHQCIHPTIKMGDEMGEQRLSKRIVGGEFIDAGEWPFLVSLRLKIPPQVIAGHDVLTPVFSGLYSEKLPTEAAFMHVCAGTLIHPQFVLSAMHCFVGNEGYPFVTKDPQDWVVKVGEHHLINPEDHETEIQVSKIITLLPSGKMSPDGSGDIVLLKLSQPTNTDYWAKPVCLPSADLPEPKPGTPCMVVGWGRASQDDTLHTVTPKHVELPVFNKTICERIYSPYGLHVSDDALCAGGNEPGKGACQFDSGGPFVCKDRSGTWNYIGITSWGIGCGDAYFPGVYTNVLRHLGWVEKAIFAELD